MKFYKYLIVLLFILSLTSFVVGCGGGGTYSADDDPATSGENDPAQSNSTTDETGAAQADGAKTDGAKTDGAK